MACLTCKRLSSHRFLSLISAPFSPTIRLLSSFPRSPKLAFPCTSCQYPSLLPVPRRLLSTVDKSNIDPFFTAKGYVVIGASPHAGSMGHAIVEQIKRGYKGELYLVNPKGGDILGCKAHKSIADLPGEGQIEAACIAIHAGNVIDAVKQCLAKGIRYFVVVSAGWAEQQGEGKKRQKELVKVSLCEGMPYLFLLCAPAAFSMSAAFSCTSCCSPGITVVCFIASNWLSHNPHVVHGSFVFYSRLLAFASASCSELMRSPVLFSFTINFKLLNPH